MFLAVQPDPAECGLVIDPLDEVANLRMLEPIVFQTSIVVTRTTPTRAVD